MFNKQPLTRLPIKAVMVSSTFTDLEQHRAELMKALRKERLFPIAMEEYVPSPEDDLISSSLDMVHQASAYIGLISHRYGQVPQCDVRNPNGYSISRLEFEEAQQLGLPTLMFLMGDKHPGTKGDFETDCEKIKKLDEYRQRAKEGRIYVNFESLGDFTPQAIHAVARLRKFLDQQPSPPEHIDSVELTELRPLISLADKLGRLGQTLLPGPLRTIELRYAGKHEQAPRLLMLAALKGAIRNLVEPRQLHAVSVQQLAQRLGIESAFTRVEGQNGERSEEVELRLEGGERTVRVAGTLLEKMYEQITRIGAFRVDVQARGRLLLVRNRDVPGVIGKVGTILGDAGVNIGEYHQVRLMVGGEALGVVSVDSSIPPEVYQTLTAFGPVLDIREVDLD